VARALQFWHLVIIVLIAAMLGTALGDIIGRAIPDTAMGRFLSAAIPVGTAAPWDLDLRVVSLTFGFSLRLTVLGAAGAAGALIVFFRRM
jgi:hypothetical protein